MTAQVLPLRFEADGLVPAVIQDATTNAVLMVGFMNEQALAATRATGHVHFWSRSRQTLWRKGETSGHEQIVRDIYVNCDQNSLLVTVDQIGAVCHDGYDTCYYRRLDPDNQLDTVRERTFDPATVYGQPGSPEADLAGRSRAYYEAFAYLRDHDLSAISRTSALLRDAEAALQQRIADELRELAGVVDGTHRHADPRSDLLLEGTQVLYWVTLAALRNHVAWPALRPDRALSTVEDNVAPGTVARMLRAEANRWENAPAGSTTGAAGYHASLALVGQAMRTGGITPQALIDADLADLRAKPYMREYFSTVTPTTTTSGPC